MDTYSEEQKDQKPDGLDRTLTTKLFEDVDKIKELPALYESKLGEMRDLVKIIGDKLWRGI